MRVIEGFKRTASRFTHDDNGNIAMIFGLTVTTLMMAVGFGVNIAQSYDVKTSLRDALDAAITSTARDITTGKIDKKNARASVEKFLTANRDTRFVTAGTYSLESVVVDYSTGTLDAVASANVDLAFAFFTTTNPKVRVNSAATYTDKQIEIAMMLDVTGSMEKKGKKDKIGDLRTAAANAVKALLKDQDPKNPRVRVALVPYASGVNTGELSRNIFVEKASQSNLPPLADDPLLAKFKMGKDLPSYGDYTSVVTTAYSAKDKCATERKLKDGSADFSADGPDTVRTDKSGKKYYAMVNRDDHLSGQGLNICPDAEIIPMTADSEALLDSIEDFKANGYTAGAIAVQWTYYMLSPKWRETIKIAGLGDGPSNYDKKKISKVAILMTDGQFNTAFAGVDGNYNGQGATTRNNAQSICDNMKKDGIEIFTIGFDLDDPGMKKSEQDQAKAVLKDCSTEDVSSMKHYYEASTGEELNRAFQSIIANTETVALTK